MYQATSRERQPTARWGVATRPARPVVGVQRSLLGLQLLAGNRAVAGFVSSAAGTAARGSSFRSRLAVQREHEKEFAGNPQAFLEKNVLTLDPQRGLQVRSAAIFGDLDKSRFLEFMDKVEKHWFVLVKDPTRSTKDLDAYLLTPAIEKYVETYPELNDLQGLQLPKVLSPEHYIEAAYVPYFRGKAPDPEKDIGHRTVKRREGAAGFNPNFVFTATMNGCAFTVTGSARGDSFTAWHYQSPGSDVDNARRFREERTPTDWFGSEEYEPKEPGRFFEAQNLLWRDKDRWNILSQVTESQTGRNTDPVKLLGVTSRPLALDPGQEFVYQVRIVAGRVQSLLKLFDGFAAELAVAPPELMTERDAYLAIRRHFQADLDAVTSAASLPELRDVLVGAMQKRPAVVDKAEKAAGELLFAAQHLRATEESRMWMLRSDEKIKRLGTVVNATKNSRLALLEQFQRPVSESILETHAGKFSKDDELRLKRNESKVKGSHKSWVEVSLEEIDALLAAREADDLGEEESTGGGGRGRGDLVTPADAARS